MTLCHEFRPYSDQLSFPPLCNSAPSNLSAQRGLHGTKSYQMGVHGLLYICLGILRMINRLWRHCRSESLHDTNIWPFSKFFLFSFNNSPSPPSKEVSPGLSSFRLITGCYYFLNSLFELPNASFFHLEVWDVGRFLPQALKSSLQIATLMTSESLLSHF